MPYPKKDIVESRENGGTENTQETVKVWIEDGVIYAVYLKNTEITLELKKEHHRLYKELVGERYMPLLLEIEEGVTVNRDARAFSKKIEEKQPFTACAVFVKSLSFKILANFYARFYKPKKPFKVFDDKHEALKWLQQYKQSK